MEELLREAWATHGSVPAHLKHRIVLEHTALINYIVNRLAARLPSHVDLEDLRNSGVIGLIDAIDKFDPSKDCKFKTYAEFRVKGAILDQLRCLDWVPRSVRQKGRQLEKAYEEVEHRLGRSANDDEIADAMGLGLDEFHQVVHKVRGISMVHLDQIPAGDDSDGMPLQIDFFEDKNADDPFQAIKSQEDRTSVADGIAHLTERERLVITLYYYEDLSMKEIGLVLGVTESRVCQIHAKSLAHLRARLKHATLQRRNAILRPTMACA